MPEEFVDWLSLRPPCGTLHTSELESTTGGGAHDTVQETPPRQAETILYSTVLKSHQKDRPIEGQFDDSRGEGGRVWVDRKERVVRGNFMHV